MSLSPVTDSGAPAAPPPGLEATMVALSDAAAARVAFLLKEEGRTDAFLRISVSGGGCAGFQYGFDFDDKPQEDDLVIEKDGATVHIDQMSLGFMGGAIIDYVEDMLAAAFQIRNPNAASSCGCGSSFSI